MWGAVTHAVYYTPCALCALCVTHSAPYPPSLAQGGVAYVNLEPGDCHGDGVATRALLDAGVSRVLVGLKHPLRHLRGGCIAGLREAGLEVAVLGEVPTEEGLEQGAAEV